MGGVEIPIIQSTDAVKGGLWSSVYSNKFTSHCSYPQFQSPEKVIGVPGKKKKKCVIKINK
jgi:hypothetical protein